MCPLFLCFQHPWLVGIVKTESRELHCGGSLIHPNWILTASHCFFDNGKKKINLEETNLTAVFGIDDLGLDIKEIAYKRRYFCHISKCYYSEKSLSLSFICVHAVFFIRNKVKNKLVVFLIFSQIYYGFIS